MSEVVDGGNQWRGTAAMAELIIYEPSSFGGLLLCREKRRKYMRLLIDPSTTLRQIWRTY